MNLHETQLVACIGGPFAGSYAEEVCRLCGGVSDSVDGLPKRWVSVGDAGISFVLGLDNERCAEMVCAVHFQQQYRHGLPFGLRFDMSTHDAAVALGREVRTERVRSPLGRFWACQFMEASLVWTLTFKNRHRGLILLTVEHAMQA
jgi:hypothetical protein